MAREMKYTIEYESNGKYTVRHHTNFRVAKKLAKKSDAKNVRIYFWAAYHVWLGRIELNRIVREIDRLGDHEPLEEFTEEDLNPPLPEPIWVRN